MMTNDQTARLGLGNAIADETEVLHTSILGKRAFGRITDLLLAWTEKNFNVAYLEASNLRVLTQALLEFAYPEGKTDLGYMEFAIENDKRYVSVRFPYKLKEGLEQFEKEITQYWMNDTKAMLVKKNLGPHDRVEVRYHERLELIEWRVIIRVGEQEIELSEPSFMVYVDGGDKVTSFHDKYTDMGDLPFEKLLSEVYKTSQDKKPTAELFFEGQSLQGEEEVARVVFEREQQEMEEELRISRGLTTEEEVERVVKANTITEDEHDDITIKATKFADENIAKIRAEQADMMEQAKAIVKDAKARELQAQRRMMTFHQKMQKLEEMLRRKEMAIVRTQNQVKILSERLTDLQSKTSGDGGNAKKFREKALQMHSMLVKVKEENANLEKLIKGLKNKEKDAEASAEADQILARSTSVANVQLEEVSKKADRLQRALDAEKIKVKQLSERVMSAERESQSAGPIIEDLERKVEQALKMTQHHKKETEGIKQKLVASEQEKNKLLNEIHKAKAEIQTLLKRQAG